MAITNEQKALTKILVASDWRVTRVVAEKIVDQIALDSAYSEDEKEYLSLVRSNDLVWYSRGTEAFLNRLLSNLNLRFHRDEMHKDKLASLDSAILNIVGVEGDIGEAKAGLIFDYIKANGYTEKIRSTVQYLYSGERMNKDAKAWLKKQIATERAARAHKAWVDRKADTELGLMFEGNFQGAHIDMTKGCEILAILFEDSQYSDVEKATMANLYRNANWSEGVKDYVQDEIHGFTTGMTLDGFVLDVFLQAINEGTQDLSVDAFEASQIVADLNLGADLSENKARTILYCIQTFPSSDEVQTVLENALEAAQDLAGKKRVEATAKIVEAAKNETPVEDKETAKQVTPSKTLMAAYDALKNARGQITARQADEFVAAIFKDGKYTENEQETMRLLRSEEVFTNAANREILLEIRRHVAARNFQK